MAKLFVSIVVDWEGEHFRNLQDLLATRRAIQNSLGSRVPFTHFICPTYWLPESQVASPTKAIRSVVTKGDEIALHVHAWQSLVEHAGLTFVAEPDWNLDGSGHGVPLGVYGPKVHHIIATARTLLQNQMSATVHGFRCGGAMTDDAVFEALMALGFRYDCSAFPPEVVSQGFGKTSRGNLRDCTGARNEIASYLVDLWGYTLRREGMLANSMSHRANAGRGIHPWTQPYRVKSQASSLVEMPGCGGISDYAGVGFMNRTFDRLLQEAREGSTPKFFNIGCHQEGAGRWKKPLMDFCHGRRAALRSEDVVITTVAKASRVAHRMLPT